MTLPRSRPRMRAAEIGPHSPHLPRHAVRKFLRSCARYLQRCAVHPLTIRSCRSFHQSPRQGGPDGRPRFCCYAARSAPHDYAATRRLPSSLSLTVSQLAACGGQSGCILHPSGLSNPKIGPINASEPALSARPSPRIPDAAREPPRSLAMVEPPGFEPGSMPISPQADEQP